MLTTVNQRWRDRRADYRPAGEPIRTADYSVAPLGESEAKAFVLAHHYSASYPASRFRFGLYRGAELTGVAVFSVPAHPRVITNWLPGEANESVELGRFVLLDDVPGNGETWFLARAFELLRREGLLGVISFADPVPRRCADGGEVFPGHVGTIYQAFNAVYCGRAKARTLKLLPDGSVFSDRAASKLRTGDRGYRYAAELLERHGAQPLRGDRRAWTRRWLTALTRPLKHGGNHRYVWALQKCVRRHLPDTLPYPKLHAAMGGGAL